VHQQISYNILCTLHCMVMVWL